MNKIVYVAGPYSKGDVAVNVKRAIDRGTIINDEGDYAVIPHLTHFMHMLHPRPYDYWIKLDNMIIPLCDKLIRLPGESSGADDEVKLAQSLRKEIILI